MGEYNIRNCGNCDLHYSNKSPPCSISQFQGEFNPDSQCVFGLQEIIFLSMAQEIDFISD
ncbi:hypothetical protein GOV13_00980 [Candidatus Pacearchaeota archaeon]|nr:hypothetical protein [Candidatus Pacearchaeota archaeon]